MEHVQYNVVEKSQFDSLHSMSLFNSMSHNDPNRFTKFTISCEYILEDNIKCLKNWIFPLDKNFSGINSVFKKFDIILLNTEKIT